MAQKFNCVVIANKVRNLHKYKQISPIVEMTKLIVIPRNEESAEMQIDFCYRRNDKMIIIRHNKLRREQKLKSATPQVLHICSTAGNIYFFIALFFLKEK